MKPYSEFMDGNRTAFKVTVQQKSKHHPTYKNGSEIAYYINGYEAQVINVTRGYNYTFKMDFSKAVSTSTSTHAC